MPAAPSPRSTSSWTKKSAERVDERVPAGGRHPATADEEDGVAHVRVVPIPLSADDSACSRSRASGSVTWPGMSRVIRHRRQRMSDKLSPCDSDRRHLLRQAKGDTFVQEHFLVKDRPLAAQVVDDVGNHVLRR